MTRLFLAMTIACGLAIAVLVYAVMPVTQPKAETPMTEPVNKDYFESAAHRVFDAAFADETFAVYQELKSEFSSDFRGAAQVSAAAVAALDLQPMDRNRLSDFAVLAPNFPEVISPDFGQPDGMAKTALADNRSEAIVYRFSDGPAVLILQDF